MDEHKISLKDEALEAISGGQAQDDFQRFIDYKNQEMEKNPGSDISFETLQAEYEEWRKNNINGNQ